jgi:outer membrane lipoprotein-sorting protein
MTLRIIFNRWKENMRFRFVITSLMVSCFVFASSSVKAKPTAKEIVDRAEVLLWGKTVNGDFDMTISTPSWTRTLALKVWMDRPTKSFLRVMAPAKDAGILSLRIGAEMWNYLPAIERTIKVPPSMMLQPWLGSDFTNDDLTKESSIVNDYTHKILGEKLVSGENAYEIEALPKPGAVVVWGKIIYSVRHDFVPLKMEYYDERGERIRVLNYSDIRDVGGRAIPTRWEMQPDNKPGKRTTIMVKAITYDKPIKPEVFSLQSLDRKE